MISVITPTHSAQFLADCYRSLAAQTVRNWEWLVLLNGPHQGRQDARDALRVAASHDDRVRIVDDTGDGPMRQSVGRLKATAASMTVGGLIVELDHDDELLPTCLERVQAVWQNGAEFVYSNSVGWGEDGRVEQFGMNHGWTFEPFYWRDCPRRAYHAFPVTPRSLYQIWYAPNHVRAWDRTFYTRIGGHAAHLSVADDHDLLCRTYLATDKITHIPEVLYAQRLHAHSTSVLQNGELTRLQTEIGNKYLHDMVLTWCRRRGLRCIDLGGAHNPADGYETLDVDGDVTIRVDVRNAYELFRHIDPDSVGVFRATDFLEHLVGDDIPGVLNNLYDALVDQGWLLTHTPTVDAPDGTVGRGAFQDPTHRSFWTPNSFLYFTDDRFKRFVPKYRGRFQAVRTEHGWPSEFHRQYRLPYMSVDLLALKQTRPPGLIAC